jgi:hypothetical protein
MSLTFTDIFCGAGGSSIGLTAAGFELKLAANHWQRAIDTHSANFRDAEHLCADVNNYDMRRLPRTDVLWASPICTEASPAAGTSGYRRPRKVGAGQLGLLELEAFGHIPTAGMERTRATFHDVIRATEVHRYLAVIVENVPDVVDRWELFDWWVDGMRRLGYHAQFVSASSAHVGGPGNRTPRSGATGSISCSPAPASPSRTWPFARSQCASTAATTCTACRLGHHPRTAARTRSAATGVTRARTTASTGIGAPAPLAAAASNPTYCRQRPRSTGRTSASASAI